MLTIHVYRHPVSLIGPCTQQALNVCAANACRLMLGTAQDLFTYSSGTLHQSKNYSRPTCQMKKERQAGLSD